jgi:hypothetical protein
MPQGVFCQHSVKPRTFNTVYLWTLCISSYKTGQAEKLQEYIYQVFNVNVYQWPIRLNEINRLVREWVADNYKDTIYPQIQEVIDSISPDDIKRFVKHLVAEDAFVGVRLLASIDKKNK